MTSTLICSRIITLNSIPRSMSSGSQSSCTSGAGNAAPGAPNEHADMLRFWEQHSAKATISSMFLDEEPFAYADEDTAEVLATLPDFAGGAVVELGAGIGCATSRLSSLFSSSALFPKSSNRHIDQSLCPNILLMYIP